MYILHIKKSIIYIFTLIYILIYNYFMEEILKVITENNALITTLISLVGLNVICELVRLFLAISSRIKNRKKRGK